MRRPYHWRSLERRDPQYLADVLAGESSARVLAERWGTTDRTIYRARARLRAAGLKVGVPCET